MTGMMRTSLAIVTGVLLAAPMALPSGTAVAAAPRSPTDS
jgi:hypothetical protein